MAAEGMERGTSSVGKDLKRKVTVRSEGSHVDVEASEVGEKSEVCENPSQDTKKTQESKAGGMRATLSSAVSGASEKMVRWISHKASGTGDYDEYEEDVEEIEASQAPSGENAVGGRIGTITTVPSWGTALHHHGVRCIVGSKWFDLITGLVIVANSLTIGLEQSFRKEGGNEQALEAIAWLEHVFLGVYIVELILRLVGFGVECLRDNWVKFDVALVILGISTAWILEPIFGQDRGELAPLMVIRTMRLLRLARMVRLLVKFRVLWMLVRGLLNSAGTMFYTLVLLVLILYVFSAVGIEIITNSPYANGPEADEEFRKIANKYFSSLPSAMLTLMQFVCLDSIGAIYRPLIQRDVTLAIYFALIILVIPIVVMNLVTAIIVNSALEQAMQDKEAARVFEEQKRARLIKKLRLIFLRLDDDKSGQVSREELAKVNQKDMLLLCESTNISDPMEIFAALDIDGSGQISIDEFCDGIWQVVASKSPLEVQRMEKQVAVIFRRLKEVENKQAAMQEVIDEIIQVQEAMQEMLVGGGRSQSSAGSALDAATAEFGRVASAQSQVRPTTSRKSVAQRVVNLDDSLRIDDSMLLMSAGSAGYDDSGIIDGDGSNAVAALRSSAILNGHLTTLQVQEETAGDMPCGRVASSGGTESTAAEGADGPRNRSHKLQDMETIQEAELADALPELVRAGTEALEGGPAWAKELLAELRHFSSELAPTWASDGQFSMGHLATSESCEDPEQSMKGQESMKAQGSMRAHGSSLGTRAPLGPPETARPRLLTGKVEFELEPEPPPEPPLPPQNWPELRTDI